MIGANVDEDDDLVDSDYSDYYLPIFLTTLARLYSSRVKTIPERKILRRQGTCISNSSKNNENPGLCEHGRHVQWKLLLKRKSFRQVVVKS